VEVRWSRDLPSAPASVTVIKDPAGRYFASFVVQAGPAADAARFPAPGTGAEVGIDLGLTSFAVLSDGTVVRSPAVPAPGGTETAAAAQIPVPCGRGEQ
jgi:putative transposase